MKFDWSLLLVVIVALIVYKLLNRFIGLDAMLEGTATA